MEAPAIHRLNNQVDAAASRLHRQTGAAVIAAAVEELPDGGVGVAYSIQGPTNAQQEFALFTLLKALEEHVAPGAAAACSDCEAMHVRVSAAIAALAPAFGPGAVGPMGSC